MQNRDYQVSILLSTYNGEKYIRTQIESILKQTYTNVKLFVRDDCSTDGTLDILNDYESRSNSIHIVKDGLGNLGSSGSFFELLKMAPENSYIMCSDQDDYWFEDKVEIFLEKMLNLEKSCNSDTAILIFGNMKVTNVNFDIISDSFWHFQKLNPKIALNWKKVLSQNVVTGCSMMANPQLKTRFKTFPKIKMHHDHYLAIVAAKYGVVDYIKHPTMYYVQHENNVVGASSYNLNYIIDRLRRINTTWISYYKLCKHFNLCFIQFIYFKITLNISRSF